MSATVSESAKAVRKRFLEDFEFYCKHALWIRSKDGKIVPLRLNRAQKILLDKIVDQFEKTGRVRIIILKARQLGLSTVVEARLFFRISQNSGKKALVLAHKAEATRALFGMTQRYYEKLPEALKMPTKYASRNELFFDGLDSSFVVATAGGDGVGRSETLSHLHASEMAYWPGNSAETYSGLMDTVPDRDDTEVYLESTANGVSGPFYDQWQAAVAGENGFLPVFIPWYVDDQYRNSVPLGFKKTLEEEALAERFGLDDEQICFRRIKISEKGIEKFWQEYPSTAEEAFLTSGRPVFDPVIMRELERTQEREFNENCLRRMSVDANDPKKNKFEPFSRGELHVYRELDPAEKYFIGADPAQGVGRDSSVAQVLDSNRRQVAVWRSSGVDPEYFGSTLYALGTYYNNAHIIIEYNNFGRSVSNELVKVHGYSNYYSEIIRDQNVEKQTKRLGFLTSRTSKSEIIAKLVANLRREEVEINDRTTLREMATFIVNESGKMEAETGKHDDHIMALALANFVVERKWIPVQMPEELYVDMDGGSFQPEYESLQYTDDQSSYFDD